MTRKRCPHCHQMYTPQPGDEARARGRANAAKAKKADPDHFRKLGGGRPKRPRYSDEMEQGWGAAATGVSDNSQEEPITDRNPIQTRFP